MKKNFLMFTMFMIFCMLTGCARIEQTERGVVRTFGKVTEVVEPGLTFVIPIMEDIVRMPVKTDLETVTLEAGTKDQQLVGTKINVNYHLNPAKVSEIYSNYGKDYVRIAIRPKIAEAITGTVPMYTAEELLRNREGVRSIMDSTLKAKLVECDIIVDNVAIESFTFSKAYTDAIERKQIAEQDAKTEKNRKDQAKYIGEQEVIKAEAKRDAIKAELEALKMSNSAEYIKMKAIEKWDGKLPVSMSGNTLPFLDIGK